MTSKRTKNVGKSTKNISIKCYYYDTTKELDTNPILSKEIQIPKRIKKLKSLKKICGKCIQNE